MEAISEKIKACEDSREELKMVGDYFRMRTKKYEVLGDPSSVRENFRTQRLCAGKSVCSRGEGHWREV